ncbi:MAG: hypothetical protein WBP53_13565, partial [Dokdonella sp.]
MNSYLQSLWRYGSGFDAWRLYQSIPASRPQSLRPDPEPRAATGRRLELGGDLEVLIRPIRPDDAAAMQRAFKRLTPD